MKRRLLIPCAALLVLAVVLLAAGCGGSSKASAPAASTQTSAAPSGGGRFDNSKLASCLSDQGVKLPSGQGQPGQPGQGLPPGGGGGAFNNPKTRAAFQKCRQYLPNGGQFNRNGRPGANSQALAKYRQCLTADGVKLTGSGPLGGANVASPAFQKAAAACRQYVPRVGGQGGAPASGTSTGTTP